MAEKQPIKEQIKKLTDQIEAGIKALFQSGDLEKYQAYLRTMSHFHHYSVNNQMLIFSQCPHATLVAGYQKWQNQFSRHVLRGEKGISVLAPTPYKIKVEKEKLDPDTKLPLLDADGNTITEEKEVQIPMFRPVKVFDVSQTDGKPLPEQVKSPVAELTGNVEHYEAFMDALKLVSPVPIEIKPLSSNLDGFFSPSKQSITLREGMSEVQTVCAAVHEIAHSKLHNYARQPDSQPKDSSTEEMEAESIAYTVCAYFGIETSANSFGYVATWSKDKDVKAFRASLDTIRKTSSELISGVDQHFKEICKERGISLEPEKPAQEQDTEKLYMVDNENISMCSGVTTALTTRSMTQAPPKRWTAACWKTADNRCPLRRLRSASSMTLGLPRRFGWHRWKSSKTCRTRTRSRRVPPQKHRPIHRCPKRRRSCMMCRKLPRYLPRRPTPVCPLPRCAPLGTWTRICCRSRKNARWS